MIQAYSMHGKLQEALLIFEEMNKSDSLDGDGYTYSSILSVIANLGNLQKGQLLHSQLMVWCIIYVSNIYTVCRRNIKN
jgi:pentatricopeptide repeat protein